MENYRNKEVILKKNNKIVFAGKIFWQKRNPICISNDNIIFFNTRFFDIIEINIDSDDVIYHLDGLNIDYWKNKNKNGEAEVYIEKYIDDELIEIIKKFNNLGFRTTGSCSGHGIKFPWIEFQIDNWGLLIKLLNYIKDPWYIKLLNEENNKINLRLEIDRKKIFKGFINILDDLKGSL